MTAVDVNRPTDSDEISDATVLNDVIQTWQEIEVEMGVTVPFPEAVRIHYRQLRDLVKGRDNDLTLAEELRQEITILEDWLAQFSAMQQNLPAL